MAAGPGEKASQLRLPQAPKLDETGLCAHDCECARCNLGYRPTVEQRDRAWRALRERKARREREAKEAAAAGGGEGKATKAERLRDKFAQAERTTDEVIARLAAPVERPATPEELAELRKQFGFRPTKRKDR